MNPTEGFRTEVDGCLDPMAIEIDGDLKLLSAVQF